jgi:hypothetical protein
MLLFPASTEAWWCAELLLAPSLVLQLVAVVYAFMSSGYSLDSRKQVLLSATGELHGQSAELLDSTAPQDSSPYCQAEGTSCCARSAVLDILRPMPRGQRRSGAAAATKPTRPHGRLPSRQPCRVYSHVLVPHTVEAPARPRLEGGRTWKKRRRLDPHPHGCAGSTRCTNS